MTTLPIRTSNRPECFRGFLLIAVALVCFALSPAPKAFGVSPAPDGGYPGANTAEGQSALQSLSSGIRDTALGFETLFSNTTGRDNTATGYQALFSNTTGSTNTANGSFALLSNTGNGNTATGAFALQKNTTGSSNTANGYKALFSNTTGTGNVAIGYQALFSNTISGFPQPDDGTCNAVGYQALQNNTTGADNSAIGFRALQNNVTGSYNNAVGWHALMNSTGFSNTAIGDDAGGNVSTASRVLCLGTVGGADVSDTTWIANVYNVTTQSGTTLPVVVSDGGQLGTAASSERFKKDINPMDRSSEAILRLKPVTFHYKTDSRATAQFGLIAEEVEKVNPDLVVKDKEGKVFSVRYDAVNAMLLNEFLKDHRTVQELKSNAAKQEATIGQLKKGMEVLTAQLHEQASQIQKVSAQPELSKAAPQIVVSNQ